MTDLKSHQTTIRFSAEMWGRLVLAARARDVSVAQFVRDAARDKLEPTGIWHNDPTAPEAISSALEVARETTRDHLDDSSAVWEQARQARLRSAELREDSRRLRQNADGRLERIAVAAGARGGAL